MGFILKVIKKEKLLNLEKRLVILIFLFVFTGLLFSQRENQDLKSTSDLFDKKSIYIKSLERINSGSEWKPFGYGTGEYITTIPKIRAGAVINLDSGEVIWSMNLEERIAPASLTKLAVVMTALDLASLDKEIVVSQNAAWQIPTKLGLSQNEKLNLEEAISAAILTSANDATEAIADSLGSEVGLGSSTFMEFVNKKLELLGAVDSNFVNSTGLDSDNHYSTVYDLAIIAHEAKMSYPLINRLAASSYLKLPANSNHRLIDLPNWNALLGTYPGVNGLKIGYTENAGYVTIVTSSREGKNLIAIVIGAKSIEEREIAAATLLNYGFKKEGIEPFSIDKINLFERFEEWKEQLTLVTP